MSLAEQVGSLRRAILRVINRRLNGRTSRPFQQLLALKIVAKNAPLNQSELADRLLIDAPATSRLVERLVDDGLVARCAGEDRRCVKLQVTEQAGPELELIAAATLSVDEDVRRHLSEEELRELNRLLDKALAALSGAEAERPLSGVG